MVYSAVEALAAAAVGVPLDVEDCATTRPVSVKKMRNFMVIDSIMGRKFWFNLAIQSVEGARESRMNGLKLSPRGQKKT